MWVFFIAFVVIAVYWMKHLEHFSAILIVNQCFIWIQLLFLSSIMLMPFWNTYITHFPENVAIRVAKRQILTEPAIAILAAGLAYIRTDLWDIAFILVPLLFFARKKLVKVKYFQFKKSK